MFLFPVPSEPPPPYIPGDYLSTSLQDTSLHSLSLHDTAPHSTSLPNHDQPPRYNEEDHSRAAMSVALPDVVERSTRTPSDDENTECARDIKEHDLKKSSLSVRVEPPRLPRRVHDVDPNSRAAELSEIHDYIKQARSNPNRNVSVGSTNSQSHDQSMTGDSSLAYQTPNTSLQFTSTSPDIQNNEVPTESNASFNVSDIPLIDDELPGNEQGEVVEPNVGTTDHRNPYANASNLLSELKHSSQESVDSKEQCNVSSVLDENGFYDCHDQAFIETDETCGNANNGTCANTRNDVDRDIRGDTDRNPHASANRVASVACTGNRANSRTHPRARRTRSQGNNIQESKHTFV